MPLVRGKPINYTYDERTGESSGTTKRLECIFMQAVKLYVQYIIINTNYIMLNITAVVLIVKLMRF